MCTVPSSYTFESLVSSNSISEIVYCQYYPIEVKGVRLDVSAIKDFKKKLEGQLKASYKKSFINAMLINCKQLKTKKS